MSRISTLELLAASAILTILGIVLYIVFAYRPA